uniref:U1 small nuclear ribonucleoprotein C n=1 Tax=Kalanchoe fedtschenkoi TaxID=63787 RepID=A0A7N0VAQ6_KALFE
MPRYYCDYCDTYLTHDSPSVRKQHNAGYKHKANVRTYYQQFEQELSQTMLDQKIKQHLVQAGPYQPIGAAYNQHLAGMPGWPPLMPFPRPGLPLPPNQMMPMPMRPPILPVPVPGTQSYPGAPPNMPLMAALPGPPPSLPSQMNGLPQPHLANMPTAVPPGSSEPPTSGAPPAFAPAMYQPSNPAALTSGAIYQTSNPAAPTSGGYESFGAND